ncbi:MAG: hypothetical protein J3K34DRAFT_527522 [Monoraphidium minutum]|nr:MAG: hypothetical protein J3K34DRAFT_527522 [Monoraphidium minutum]
MQAVLHQSVSLRIDKRRGLWSGHTELRMSLAAGQATVGLHCFNLRIHEVLVDGVAAQHELREYPARALAEPTLEALGKGREPLRTVADEAYSSHLRQMQLEQPPELTVTVPSEVLAAAAAAAAPQQQQEQQQLAASEGAAARATPPPPAATAAAASAGTPPPAATPAAASQQQQRPAASPAPPAGARQAPQVVTVYIRFNKPCRDGSVLAAGDFMATSGQLRRARGVFPCVDGPVYYEQGSPHVAPHTFDLALTVGPDDVAVASGRLVQQTAAVEGGDDGNGGGGGGARRVVSRTFQYAIDAPTLPQHVLFAVGPFEVVPAARLFAAGGGGGGAAGSAAAAAAAGPPVVTAFYPRPCARTCAAAAQPPRSGARPGEEWRNNGGAAALSLGGGGGGADGAEAGPAPAAALAALRPLALLLRQCEKLLGCRAPFSHLQVAVMPAEAAGAPYLSGLGCVLLSADLVAPEGCVEGAMESVAALAGALARQFFGVLMLPPAPEDAWLLEGLACWLEGNALRSLLGANEVAYRRWQERAALAAVDDGAQLAPLSEVLPGADKERERERGGRRDRDRERDRDRDRDADDERDAAGAGGGGGARGAPAYAGPSVNKDTTSGWGLTYGSQAQEPWQARAWKAGAVMLMAERRIGEGEEFKRMLERVVVAARPEVAAAESPDPVKPRLQLSTSWFLKNMRKKAEGSATTAKEDASAFRQRWVNGAGMPALRAAYQFDARGGALQLALRQGGGLQCLKAALRSKAKAEGLKVMVRELGGEVEHLLSLGVDEALALRRLEVSLDRHTVKRGPGRRPKEPKDPGTGPGVNPDAAEQLGIPESELVGIGALWVRLDPGLEWLADIRIAQPLTMWRWQLQHSKDVLSQAQAVAGLASLQPVHEGVIQVLAAALRRPTLFCRVRADAALALGATASDATNMEGARALVKYWRDQCYDPATDALRPNCFADTAEYLVLRSVPAALALVRNAQGTTPDFVLDLLLAALRENDNSHNAFGDAHWLAGLVAALGGCRPADAAQLARVLSEIDRQLAHEAVVGTHRCALGAACLRAITDLACRVQPPPGAALDPALAAAMASDPHVLLGVAAAAAARALLGDVRRLLARHAGPGAPRHMRGAAQACLMQVAAYEALHAPLAPPPAAAAGAPPQPPPLPVDAALRAALGLMAREPPGPGRAALLRAALLVVAGLERDLGLDLPKAAATAGAAPVSADVVAALTQLLGCHGDPALRQLAFMLLQRVAGQPATLYRRARARGAREREEEGDQALLAADPAERSVSARTGAPAGGTQLPARSGLPAASGGASLGGGQSRSHLDGAPARSAGTFAGTGTFTNARPSRVRLGIKLPSLRGDRGAGSAGAAAASGAPGSASKEPPASPATGSKGTVTMGPAAPHPTHSAGTPFAQATPAGAGGVSSAPPLPPPALAPAAAATPAPAPPAPQAAAAALPAQHLCGGLVKPRLSLKGKPLGRVSLPGAAPSGSAGGSGAPSASASGGGGPPGLASMPSTTSTGGLMSAPSAGGQAARPKLTLRPSLSLKGAPPAPADGSAPPGGPPGGPGAPGGPGNPPPPPAGIGGGGGGGLGGRKLNLKTH